jgi:peptide chain release factor 2
MTRPDFWDRRDEAQAVVQEVSALKNVLEPFAGVEMRIDDFAVLAELAESEGTGSDLLREADDTWPRLEAALARVELTSFLSGKFDRGNAFFSIHAGAGGTESCDWTSMLLRMYERWFEGRGWKTELLDIQPGDEAGTKSVTLRVVGDFAYGYLRGERGVHRLVRISPYDSNKRWHTSFSAVDVVPEIDDDVEVEILDKDLREDTYRSSGAGGQYVNRTDSAVRITHLPTGTVVACQQERSQHKNRAMALRMLRAKLYELAEEKRRKELAQVSGQKTDNTFGSQIRSYVLQPYQLVKDLRTDVETSNVNAVLDGALDPFVEAYLRAAAPPAAASA